VSLRYGEGFLATLVIAVGALAVVYGLQAVALSLLQAVGLVLLVIGGYTLAFATSIEADRFFFAVWGVILSAIGAALTTSPIINPILSAGLILISLGLLGVFAILRRRGGK
jgi:hypothetical protein